MAKVMPHPDSSYPVILKPYKLNINQFGEKSRTEIEFDISNVSDQDLEITLISYQDNFFSVDIPKTVGAGKAVKGHVKVTDEKAGESFDKSLTFAVQGANDKVPIRFTIPVRRVIRKLSAKVDSVMNSTSGSGSGR